MLIKQTKNGFFVCVRGNYIWEVVLLPQVCYLQALSDVKRVERKIDVESACV